MTITEKKVVELEYELRLNSESGEIVQTVTKDRPLQFINGVGMMLPKFEENIAGLKVGDSFKFKLESNDAYGTKQENKIVEFHKDDFKINGQVDESIFEIGNVIPMMDQEGGRHNGKVLEVKGDNVKLDFNDPLADQDLYFTGKVVSIREATKQELEHGHVHSDDHECGCGSGCGCH